MPQSALMTVLTVGPAALLLRHLVTSANFIRHHAEVGAVMTLLDGGIAAVLIIVWGVACWQNLGKSLRVSIEGVGYYHKDRDFFQVDWKETVVREGFGLVAAASRRGAGSASTASSSRSLVPCARPLRRRRPAQGERAPGHQPPRRAGGRCLAENSRLSKGVTMLRRRPRGLPSSSSSPSSSSLPSLPPSSFHIGRLPSKRPTSRGARRTCTTWPTAEQLYINDNSGTPSGTLSGLVPNYLRNHPDLSVDAERHLHRGYTVNNVPPNFTYTMTGTATTTPRGYGPNQPFDANGELGP